MVIQKVLRRKENRCFGIEYGYCIILNRYPNLRCPFLYQQLFRLNPHHSVSRPPVLLPSVLLHSVPLCLINFRFPFFCFPSIIFRSVWFRSVSLRSALFRSVPLRFSHIVYIFIYFRKLC